MTQPEEGKEEQPERWRLFIALPTPPGLKTRLTKLSEDLQSAFRFTPCRISWTAPGAIHLTLRFLGATAPERVDEIASAMDRIAERHAPPDLLARRIDVFPHWNRPRVLWVGLEDRAGTLGPMQAELENAARELGFKPEEKPWRPHLTLARFKSPKGAGVAKKTVKPKSGFQAEFGPAKSMILYRSELHPEGARHVPLHESVLARS